MKAIYFNKAGDPLEVLSVGEFDPPIAGLGEVRIKVMSSPINPADILFVKGKYRYQPKFPQIAGLEGTGIIEDAGSDVALPVGTPVSFLWRNTWAEYTVVPEEELVILPAGFPVEKAAQMALNPFTAWGLLERIALHKDEWLLLTAGSSVVSQLVIQLAARKGIRVIATVRDDKQKDRLDRLGAEVIDFSVEELEKRVLEITDGKGVEGALDAVGGPTATALLKCMATNGKVVDYAALSTEPFQANNSLFVYKNISLSGFGIRGYLRHKTRQEKADIAQQLTGIMAKDDFRLDVAAKFSMTDIKPALLEAQRSQNGKVLLTF
jgi:NADPH2:quinone reductase